MASPLDSSSDKGFWHGYLAVYEGHLRGRDVASIAEFGVFKGQSIRWLRNLFPKATIHGADILEPQPEWPQGPDVHYHRIDQADRRQVKEFFQSRAFDLVIEDGSHVPLHQAHCLVEGLKAVVPGGLYILEDVHTSHPRHPMYKRAKGHFGRRIGTALSTLLAIDHLKRTGIEMTEHAASALAKGSYFTSAEVMDLFTQIGRLSLYRRAHLPDRCYSCGSVDYDYRSYRCLCGVGVFQDADSMSYLIEKRA